MNEENIVMHYQLYKPSELLSRYVHFYWIMESDELSLSSTQNRVVPNGSVNLMFHYGDVLNNRDKDNRITPQFQTMITGQSTNYFDALCTGKSQFVSVVFYPAGARLFYNIPMTHLLNQHLDIANLDPINAKYICEQLAEEADYKQKITIIEKYLLTNFSEKNLYNNLRISTALEKAALYGGNISMDELTNLACLSYKQFDRIFSDLVGLHPKQFMKVIRLQNVFRLLSNSSRNNLLDIAFLAGYYDQAHFNKEFKQFTGYTPKQCLKECSPTSDYYLTF